MNSKQWFSLLAAAALITTAIIFYLGAVDAPASPEPEVCDLVDNDLDGEVDEGFAVTCSKDSDCGESGFYGQKWCQDGDVWQGYYLQECAGTRGTCESTCVAEQTARQLEECSNGCAQGRCA